MFENNCSKYYGRKKWPPQSGKWLLINVDLFYRSFSSQLKSEDNGYCVTLEIQDEDHTLGNSLRQMIMKK